MIISPLASACCYALCLAEVQWQSNAFHSISRWKDKLKLLKYWVSSSFLLFQINGKTFFFFFPWANSSIGTKIKKLVKNQLLHHINCSCQINCCCNKTCLIWFNGVWYKHTTQNNMMELNHRNIPKCSIQMVVST